ncbi:MAG: 3D domain-containing protein [Marinoscillum sp.]|uniref:3D domain-containing protein n=1 Tax=Marinoscillum sp. TaxID=2024838 RepID=UPI0032F3EFEB
MYVCTSMTLMTPSHTSYPWLFLIFGLLLSAYAMAQPTRWDTLEVKASAYNSVIAQTKPNDATTAAWGDQLVPGMKVIAVSRDLIALGLTHNTQVKIEGMEGIFLVKDKMHPRWTKKIDIYMGEDIQKALIWGVRPVKIYYEVK